MLTAVIVVAPSLHSGPSVPMQGPQCYFFAFLFACLAVPMWSLTVRSGREALNGDRAMAEFVFIAFAMAAGATFCAVGLFLGAK